MAWHGPKRWVENPPGEVEMGWLRETKNLLEKMDGRDNICHDFGGYSLDMMEFRAGATMSKEIDVVCI